MTTREAKSEFYIAGLDNVPQIEPPRQARAWNAPHLHVMPSPREAAVAGLLGLCGFAFVFAVIVVGFVW